MNKQWKKTGIKVQTIKEDGEYRARGFNNLSADASPEKISQFAQIIGQLTGEPAAETVLTVASVLTAAE
ncbi:hypothetical protein LFYK43_10160 [Ligilactobacillus salitolerans]|uniref:DUF1659 domain-containing protein n=1 Tax=Ligilactobacillus salitolerans TaxID=1808352 RepID=A0A401ISS7_9LACO|nr:hypothetical protein [Ligilactobacillus salitolerans]GBG94557.1 hypothetical protein LFYK43_10160 [Ligilactobacillus salitolerans]